MTGIAMSSEWIVPQVKVQDQYEVVVVWSMLLELVLHCERWIGVI